jgi:hypothetical protein
LTVVYSISHSATGMIRWFARGRLSRLTLPALRDGGIKGRPTNRRGTNDFEPDELVEKIPCGPMFPRLRFDMRSVVTIGDRRRSERGG